MTALPDVPIAERLMLRIPEAAALLGSSEPEVYRLIAAGDLKAVRLGTRYRITRGALDAFVERLEADEASETEKLTLLVRKRRKRA